MCICVVFVLSEGFLRGELLKTDIIVLLEKTLSDECLSCISKDNCYGRCLAMNYASKYPAHSTPLVYCKTISNIEKAWQIIWE